MPKTPSGILPRLIRDVELVYALVGMEIGSNSSASQFVTNVNAKIARIGLSKFFIVEMLLIDGVMRRWSKNQVRITPELGMPFA
jgi:hypothetical protein